ncbi:MAG: type IV pilus secretin PilQ [Pseudomonadota bacterium]
MLFEQKKNGMPIWRIFCIIVSLGVLGGCVASRTEPVDDKVQPGKAAITRKVVQSVEVVQKPGAVSVNISSSGRLTYTSVKQSFPLGIAVYLPDTVLADTVALPQTLKSGCVNTITGGYADDERSTARIDILLNNNADYEILEAQEGLTVVISGPLKPMVSPVQGTDASNQSKIVPPAGETSPQAGPAVVPDTPAILTGIEFTSSDTGESQITVKTSHPIHYDVKRIDKQHLHFVLLNTDIPGFRQRPLITSYFKSAVEKVLPRQKGQGNTRSRLEIEMRESVPYQVVQHDSLLTIRFEPSSVDPPVFDKAEATVTSGPRMETVTVMAKDQAGQAGQAGQAAGGPGDRSQDMAASSAGPAPKYIGEKIRLDFFETDIKNVFRILQSISGQNFAVDKDVTGNVTLTLDKPVPWDQVLDLVLKMNRLGQVMEGSINRIATLDTLRKEEEMLQASIAAKQRTLEQEKKLEPLFTEYIPINYSSAETDIKPHIEKILTPDRGQVSVDSRTNMVILTDVKDKIDQAREMIYRLDKVTPQIMIAARIVEVSKDFSRELGISWNLASLDVYNQELGGTYGYDLAMNYPVASSSGLGYTFSRIAGTPFALNAKLTASETKGDVKIISSPRILTLDNKKAKIKQGLEYAYLERDESGLATVSFKNIDLLLEVTPHVTPDDRISMNVYITKNDIDSVTDGVPSLSTNEAETELLVNDGNTIVIGGIVKTSSSKGKSGFPFLSDIPLLGHLFRSDTSKEKNNELLIFITPTIVQLEQRRN